MPAAIPDGFGMGGAYAPPPQPGVTGGTFMPEEGRAQVIDGTPARVAVLGLSAAAILIALRWGGFRFNVAVSN